MRSANGEADRLVRKEQGSSYRVYRVVTAGLLGGLLKKAGTSATSCLAVATQWYGKMVTRGTRALSTATALYYPRGYRKLVAPRPRSVGAIAALGEGDGYLEQQAPQPSLGGQGLM